MTEQYLIRGRETHVIDVLVEAKSLEHAKEIAENFNADLDRTFHVISIMAFVEEVK